MFPLKEEIETVEVIRITVKKKNLQYNEALSPLRSGTVEKYFKSIYFLNLF